MKTKVKETVNDISPVNYWMFRFYPTHITVIWSHKETTFDLIVQYENCINNYAVTFLLKAAKKLTLSNWNYDFLWLICSLIHRPCHMTHIAWSRGSHGWAERQIHWSTQIVVIFRYFPTYHSCTFGFGLKYYTCNSIWKFSLCFYRGHKKTK